MAKKKVKESESNSRSGKRSPGMVDKYAKGGKCRGMGAAKRGGKFTRSG